MEKLILGLIGATTSFIYLVLEKKDSDKRRILAVLASVGFIVLIGSAFADFTSSKASNETLNTILTEAKELDNDIDGVIAAINALKSHSASQIGVELRSIEELDRHIKGFEKGTTKLWEGYFEWLENTKGKKYLKLKINSNKRYRISLILLYLLSNKKNERKIKSIISDYGSWKEFPKVDQLKELMKGPILCEYMLFFNQNNKLVGFSKSDLLIRDLVTVKFSGLTSEFEDYLNDQDKSFKQYAQKNLSSFTMALLSNNNSKEIAEELISNGLNESVTLLINRPYVFRLTDMINKIHYRRDY